jgi:toluene monooxygenase electron transfer component
LGQSLNWSGHVGFVHEHLPSQLPRPLSDFEYYFAGPPPMIEATVRMLTLEQKVPYSQMHFDRFF